MNVKITCNKCGKESEGNLNELLGIRAWTRTGILDEGDDGEPDEAVFVCQHCGFQNTEELDNVSIMNE